MASTGFGWGKTILFGEHFVVYGTEAIAVGLDRGITVTLERSEQDEGPSDEHADAVKQAVQIIRQAAGVSEQVRVLLIESALPVGQGTGSSAALSVAIARAIAKEFALALPEERINAIAYEAEKFFHGTPSGIDNTLATYGGAILFQKRPVHPDENRIERFLPGKPFWLVIISSGTRAATREMVAEVRLRRDRQEEVFSQFCAASSRISSQAHQVLLSGDLDALGELMNLNHGLLVGIGVSTVRLDTIVHTARAQGALGAKLTGGGGGGCVIALFPDQDSAVAAQGHFQAELLAAYTVRIGS
ncbi:MAG TPA: mevalonate kinase [bacterium]|nr:mevalonate kinase [bacterium]